MKITMIVKCTIGRMYARGKVGFHFRKTALLLDSGYGKKGQHVGTAPALQQVYELGKPL